MTADIRWAIYAALAGISGFAVGWYFQVPSAWMTKTIKKFLAR